MPLERQPLPILPCARLALSATFSRPAAAYSRSYITRKPHCSRLVSSLLLAVVARLVTSSALPAGWEPGPNSHLETTMTNMNPLLEMQSIDFQWPALDPFLFCVHHHDRYGPGNGKLGPTASLAGRALGSDFSGRDGWSMYHGKKIPGFPSHPHKGFETVTVVTQGLVDHSDSMGAAGRYGQGDTQWMTAGKGVQHSEMFPLVKTDSNNELELFQIWLNLPKRSKLVDPYFTMFWGEKTPIHKDPSTGVEVTVIAGALNETKPLDPPPSSWAADAQHHVRIWLITMPPSSTFTIPATESTHPTNRMLYFYEGSKVTVSGGQSIGVNTAMKLKASLDAQLLTAAGGPPAKFLLLEGQAVEEPVVQHGPFVMNTRQEIMETFEEYQRTQFGGWPWDRSDQTHGAEGRFAKYADGKVERP
jgi:quercetin 2,3-dioxygenase